MAIWTSTNIAPKTSGRFRAKCGVTSDTFWAVWKKREKIWTNPKGETIAFGNDGRTGDVWRIAPKTQS